MYQDGNGGNNGILGSRERPCVIGAGYIFGDNQSQTKMAMTAPVQSASGSTKMAMTAPVTSAPGKSENTSVYRFVMESKYDESNLPLPNDQRVTIRRLPEATIAVLSYSGSWSQEKYAEKEAELRASLSRDGLEVVAPAQFARYNAPFTPSFLRRNEVMIQVKSN